MKCLWRVSIKPEWGIGKIKPIYVIEETKEKAIALVVRYLRKGNVIGKVAKMGEAHSMVMFH